MTFFRPDPHRVTMYVGEITLVHGDGTCDVRLDQAGENTSSEVLEDVSCIGAPQPGACLLFVSDLEAWAVGPPDVQTQVQQASQQAVQQVQQASQQAVQQVQQQVAGHVRGGRVTAGAGVWTALPQAAGCTAVTVSPVMAVDTVTYNSPPWVWLRRALPDGWEVRHAQPAALQITWIGFV